MPNPSAAPVDTRSNAYQGALRLYSAGTLGGHALLRSSEDSELAPCHPKPEQKRILDLPVPHVQVALTGEKTEVGATWTIYITALVGR